jgi:hypothetical protein
LPSTGSEQADSEESSEDEDYVQKDEGDVDHSFDTDEDGKYAESESESDLEEEQKMPAQQPKPRQKSRTPPRKAAGGGDDLVRSMNKLAITSSYSLNFVCPYIMFQHARAERDCVTCEFLVPTLGEENFRVLVPVTNRSTLQVLLTIPGIFVEKTRHDRVHRGDVAFNQNTHENTAYKKLVEKISSDFDDGSPTINYVGKIQEIELPFACEEDVEWEISYFPIHNEAVSNDLGLQFYSILTVILTSQVKPKVKRRALVRVVMDEEEGDGDGDGDGGAGMEDDE